MKTVICAVLSASAFIEVGSAQDKSSSIIEGSWQGSIIYWQGTRVPEAQSKKFVMNIRGATYRIFEEEELVDEGQIKSNLTKRPAELDICSNRLKQCLYCIAETSNDMLKLCIAPPGRARPRDFSSDKDNGNSLFFFKKQKR